MVEAPHLNDVVLFYNMAGTRPGPYAAKVLAINSDGSLDLEVARIEGNVKEVGVFSRHLAETGRMWDWPKTRALQS